MNRYVEFAVTSNFSFLSGASHPEELMAEAAQLDLAGLGLCDRNSVAGVVRAHVAKRESDWALAYHPGARLVFADGTPDILAYPRNRAGWGKLCRLLTCGNRRAKKADCLLYLEDLLAHIADLELIVMTRSTRDEQTSAMRLKEADLDDPSAERQISQKNGEGSANDSAKIMPTFGATNGAVLTIVGSDLSTLPSQAPASGTDPASLAEKSRRQPIREAAGGLERRTIYPHPAATKQPALHAVVPANIEAHTDQLKTPPPARASKTRISSKRRDAAHKKPEHLLGLLHRLKHAAPDRVRLAASVGYSGSDQARLARLSALASQVEIPLLAINDVLYHTPERRPLQDVLTAIRTHVPLDAAGRRLSVNAERHLKTPAAMAWLFRSIPEAIEETCKLSARLTFSLDELAYQYPDTTWDGFATPQDALEHLSFAGAAERYPAGVPDKVRCSLEHELELIATLNYAPYFLTVYDTVRFARTKHILCQGRGSAANSAVCYCLGITEVDPDRVDLLFERFVSAERREPPDIDVDFEHERREEVIQHIYARYGREHAGIAATVISYRARSAVREVGQAFGLSQDAVGTLASHIWGFGGEELPVEDLLRAGLDQQSPRVKKMLGLIGEIIGFPRHLSQHVGGFVITRDRLDEVVPIGNAAMEERTFVEWDKDDLDALGILKIDVLGLGMLTCLRKALSLLAQHYGERLTLASIPAEDPAVYRMLQRADSIGVFQVESRAQMSMLPRLKPQEFYDLVIEVAIVRPGPIQGDMVHPYLRRRQKIETISYPSKELEEVLRKTLGVPLFQEQAMRIAIVAAGFTPSEADRLRRAMATFRRVGTIGMFKRKMIEGMVAKDYDRAFAERCFQQIEGFGEYGFPESHAASFALLVYASAWLKCRYPDVFAAALLNAQPMGFYAPAQIVRDVREHGVEVRAVDINHSQVEATLEPGPAAATRVHEIYQEMAQDIRTHSAIRLGLKEIKGLAEDDAKRIVERRGRGYDSLRDVWLRTGLSPRVLERLADADAFGSLRLTRREALWAAKALGRAGDQDDLPLWRAAKSLFEPPMPNELPLQQTDHPATATAPSRNNLTLISTGLHGTEVGGQHQSNSWQHLEAPDEGKRELELAGSRPDFHEPEVNLPPMPLGEEVVNDYRFLQLSLRAHPASFLRADLERRGVMRNSELRRLVSGSHVTVSGLITVRQRPGSANGVIFMSIEDETALANIIVWPKQFARFRPIVLGARYVSVSGRMQEECGVIHVVADALEDLGALLALLTQAGTASESPSDTIKRRPADARHAREQDKPLANLRAAALTADLDVPARATRHVIPKPHNRNDDPL
jgi:DNA-directed DNA polymerase III PolC